MLDQLLEAHDLWSFLDSTEALLLPRLIAVSHCGGGSHGWFCHHDRSRWVSQWHRVTWQKRGIRMVVPWYSMWFMSTFSKSLCRIVPFNAIWSWCYLCVVAMNVSGRDLTMRQCDPSVFFDRQRHHKERNRCPTPRFSPHFTRQDGRWISFVISGWIDFDYDGHEVFICGQPLGGCGLRFWMAQIRINALARCCLITSLVTLLPTYLVLWWLYCLPFPNGSQPKFRSSEAGLLDHVRHLHPR